MSILEELYQDASLAVQFVNEQITNNEVRGIFIQKYYEGAIPT